MASTEFRFDGISTAFLGPRFASVGLDDGKAPEKIDSHADPTADAGSNCS